MTVLTDDERHDVHCAVLDAIDDQVTSALNRLFAGAVPAKDWVSDADLPAFLPALDRVIDTAVERAAAHIRQKAQTAA